MSIIRSSSIKNVEDYKKQNILEKRSSKDFRISSPMQQVKLFQTKNQQNYRMQLRKESSSTQATALNSPSIKNMQFQYNNINLTTSADRELTDRTRQGSFGSQFSFRNNDLLSSSAVNVENKYQITDKESNINKDSVYEEISDESSSDDDNQNGKNQIGELLTEEESDEWKSINIEDIFKLFEAKCLDNKLKILPQQLFVFVDKLKATFKNGNLDLSEQLLGPLSAKRVVAILKKNAKFKCKFSRLLLGKNRLGDEGIQIVCNYIKKKKSTSIMHLDVSNNNLTPTGINTIINMVNQNENIISLDISSYEGQSRNQLSRSSCIALSQYIAQSKVLQFLRMQNCCIGPTGFFSLSKGFSINKSIISLDISKNDIGKDCGKFIESILSNSKIMELNLRGNFIGDSSIEKIGEYLKPGLKMCVLNILDISNNQLTAQGINHFFECLQKNQYIEKLILDHNNLRGELPDIIQFFQENTNITYLSMKDCYIYPDTFESIFTGLARNNSLKTLILSKNFVKDQGAEMLAQSLKADPNLITNRKLKVIDLTKCAIEELGGQMLAEAFKTHPGITDIDLRHNLLGDASGFSMIDLARNNQKLTKLNLDMNLIRLDYMIEVQKLIDMNIQTHNQLKEPYLKEKLIELKSIDIKPEDFQKKEEELIRSYNQQTIELNRYKQQYQKEEKESNEIHEKQLEEFNEIRKQAYSLTGGNKNDEILQKKVLSELERKIVEEKEKKDKIIEELQILKANKQAQQQAFNKRKIQLEEMKRKQTEKKNQMILQVEDCSKLHIDLEKKIKQLNDKVKSLQNKVNSKGNRKKSSIIEKSPKAEERASISSKPKLKIKK